MMELPTTWQEALQSGIKAERMRHTRKARFYVGLASRRRGANETFRAVSTAWRDRDWEALQQIGRNEINWKKGTETLLYAGRPGTKPGSRGERLEESAGR